MIRRVFSVALMVVMVSAVLPCVGFAAEPVTIGIVCELSGSGAPAGMRWNRGVHLAAENINAAGGMLGRKIETFTLDTGTDPAASVAAMKKAIGRKPFIVMGTVYSSSTIVNMSVLQQVGIPQITGSGATPITHKGNPNIFRTQMNTELMVQKMVKWITEILKVKKMAVIYANDAMGKGSRDALFELLPPKGVNLVSDVATEVGQADFTGELVRIKATGADTVFIYVHEEECGRILPQVRQLGLDKTMRIIGPETLLTEDTLRLAKEASNGVMGTVELSPVAKPWVPIGVQYQKKHKEVPDHNFFKGYLGLQVANAVVKEIGGFDRQKFRDFLHNRTLCVKDHPGIRNSIHYDERGDIDWETFLVTVKDQKHVITGLLPPLHSENFEQCK